MKRHIPSLAALALALSSLTSPLSTFGQGSLTPPGAPAPTMKTLSQIEPRTPISALPFTITSPGSYYLTANLTGSSGASGISISTNDVTVDLNGFTLFGAPGSQFGMIITSSYTNITIRNGTVTKWGSTGVNGYIDGYPRNVVYEHLTVSDNGSDGLDAEATSIIRDCLVMNNASSGIFTVGSLVTGCVARNNGNYGIEATGSTVHSCLAHFNGLYGILADNSTVMDCDVLNNTNNGVYVGNTCYIVNNRIANNNSGSPGNGLYLNGSYNVIANNSVLNNTYWLYTTATGTNNSIVQNKSMGNPFGSLNIYNIAPIVSLNNPSQAQNVTNANAWANFIW